MSKITARVSIVIVYDLNGEVKENIMATLTYAVEHLSNNGLLTSDNSPAVVDELQHRIEVEVE